MADSSEGHTPAAWTGVTISFIGFCVAGAFMVMAEPVGFWAGIGVVFLGGIVGLAMKAAGLGMPARQPLVVATAASGSELEIESVTAKAQSKTEDKGQDQVKADAEARG
jgi:hypothetical protein